MNKTKEAAMLMSSLSVYRGIMNRTVPAALYRLLCSEKKPVHDLLRAWGDFAGLLYERGYADSLAKCLTEAALFDENAFSEAAAAGNVDELKSNVLDAAKRDIRAINKISKITAEDIISDYLSDEDLGSVAAVLPRWETGKPIIQFADEENSLKLIADYHRVNGCGMFARFRAFIWRNESIEPVAFPDTIRMEELKGYELQRGIVEDNTVAFLKGTKCNNCLLYGDRGTGKSSTVKAILNKYCHDGLRIVEMPKDRLREFPLLVDKIASIPLKFIIFIDDLSFSNEDKSYAQLKAVLEGGLAARPDNTLIYATSNRRHLIKENFSDRDGDDLHRNDSIQESLSLSDRFGLSVNFMKPDKAVYLEIVTGLAEEYGINIDKTQLEIAAERFALERGGRSPRCARQFIATVRAGLTDIGRKQKRR